MHYTHHLHIIRKRKHTLPISIIVITLISILIFSFGYNQLNIYEFSIGFVLSLSRVIIAYFFALIVALILSLIATMNKQVEDLAVPILDVLQSFPAFSIMPLLLAFFTEQNEVAILILLLEMVWPILFSVLTGLKSENEELNEAASIFGATGWKKLVYVTLPSIFPSLITGSIVAWGEAWETVLAAEIIIKIPGIGTYLSEAGNRNDNHVLIIGILLLMTILFILNKLFWIPLLNESTKHSY